MFHQPDSSIAELVGKSEADPAMFRVPSPTDIFCELMVLVGRLPGWEYAQVTAPHRCPSWHEMKFIKDCCWDEEDVCFQLHPAKSRYVNKSEFSLWIWRPTDAEIPQPPLSREQPVKSRSKK